MKTSKSLAIVTICALSAFTIPFAAMNLRQANAYPKKDCDRFAVGTYLITIIWCILSPRTANVDPRWQLFRL
ncbi:MAG: hypothetical protein V7K48_20075 [Nostoc sp.]|uniref:hypothetical protein n=1 Tax=Nostoc sp. TaxID=1180 RepID=UPI002FF6B369